MPIGLQLIGGWFADQTVLNTASAYQSATDWHTRRPAMTGRTNGFRAQITATSAYDLCSR